MSDDNDKIVRVTDFVLPAEDFGERIASVFEEAPPEAVVDSRGETVGEVQAAPPLPRASFLTSAQILAKRESAPIVRKQPLKPKKPWMVNIGMPNGSTILPGQSVTVTEMMQIVFRAKQLVCAPSGGKLYITTALVGQRIQLMQWSGNGMLMDFLKERTDVDFDTAEPGIMIAFTILNRGDTPGTFDLTLFGEAVAP